MHSRVQIYPHSSYRLLCDCYEEAVFVTHGGTGGGGGVEFLKRRLGQVCREAFKK